VLVRTHALLVERCDEIEADLCRKHLKKFIRTFWYVIEPVLPLLWNWHLDVICHDLEAVTRGDIDHLIINVPPGTMKSLVVNVFHPAWEWASDPTLRDALFSHGDDVVLRDNVKMRKIATSEQYQRYFPNVRLSGDQNAKEKFETTEQGWRMGSTVHGAGIGQHPDRIRIDDPIKPTKAAAPSGVELRAVVDWYRNTISTRGLARAVRIILIMQRLHKEDLTGYLLKNEPGRWVHRRFPARYEPPLPPEAREPDYVAPDKKDHRWEPGQLLWAGHPVYGNDEMLRNLEATLGNEAPGQLQQRPVKKGGGIFKRAWFKVITELPVGPYRECRGWDVAATPGGGDWTAGVKIRDYYQSGIRRPRFVVMDVVHEQQDSTEVDATLKLTATFDGKACRQREEREPGSAGKTVTMIRGLTMPGYDYREVIVSKDKVTRVSPFRAQCELGNVALLHGPWNQPYVDELCDFTGSTADVDDQVDGSGCSFNELMTGEQPVRLAQVMWG
jgi:predicted phage terminase large subunit-like protein